MDDLDHEFAQYVDSWNTDAYDVKSEFFFAVIASTYHVDEEEQKNQKIFVMKATINENDYAGVTLID